MKKSKWFRCVRRNVDVNDKFCGLCFDKMSVNFRVINNIPDTAKECCYVNCGGFGGNAKPARDHGAFIVCSAAKADISAEPAIKKRRKHGTEA